MKILLNYNEWIDMYDREYDIYTTDDEYYSHYHHDSASKIQKLYKIQQFYKKLPILWNIAEYYMKKKYHPSGIYIKNFIDSF